MFGDRELTTAEVEALLETYSLDFLLDYNGMDLTDLIILLVKEGYFQLP